MNTAIVAPSINPNPSALLHIRNIAPQAEIIVVGDRKAPGELRSFCELIRAHYLGVEEQLALPYLCKEEIPWNCIMRRNLGMLEAVRHGAEIIISIDDDNTPLDEEWAETFEGILSAEQYTTVYHSERGWFNIGEFADQAFYYRGYPYSLRGHANFMETEAREARVGIANGLILGDPDINATERIEKHPEVTDYLPEAFGLCVDPRTTWTPINTQNTAYAHDCLALSFVLPGVGRYDDIWASYIANRVLSATGHVIHFGPPAVRQERNAHNVYRDLRDELHGMEYTEAFCACLKHAPVDSKRDVLGNLGIVASYLRHEWKQPFPHAFLAAWIEDMEKIA